VVEALIKAGAFDRLHPKGLDGRSELLASVGLAFDYADTQAAHADQGGLFDMFDDGGDGHGSSTQEPEYTAAETWDVKTRLTHEKVAIGYYFSGHLFDQVGAEVRQFVRREVADVSDSRDPQMLAGIVSDLRIVNGQRGRVAIFKLDDKSGAIEAVVNEELLGSHATLLKDDELLVLQGKAQPDRFSGGLRFNVLQIWDLPTARCRHARYLRVPVEGAAPPIEQLLRDHPAKRITTAEGELVQGTPLRLVVQRPGAIGEIDLGEAARFYPSDNALALWQRATQGASVLVYAPEVA
jgi:DNA polymerase-3 subunit alpha